jgi:peptidoglycan/LPS O-acetylase OafA/YrhL
MTVSKHKSASYRGDIDGLRAVAVLLVVAFHAARSIVTGGFIGVDVFFVISGYLITGLILPEMRDRRFSLLAFYARRCRRIVPALLVVLVGTLGLGCVELFPAELSNLGQHTIAGAAFLSNILLWNETGYFDTSAESKPLLHLWSLGIEEQFYLLWPLLLLLLFRRRSALVITGGLLALSLGCNVLVSRDHPETAFYMIPTRLWELLAGAFLVMLESRGSAREGVPHQNAMWLRNGMAFAALALMLACAFTYSMALHYPGGWAAAPVASTAILIAAGPRAWVNRVLLSNRVATFIGRISYPLYLWHWPLLVYLNLFTFGAKPLQAHLLKLAVVALAFLFAWLTWQFVEQPVQRRLTPLSGNLARRTVLATLAALLVTAGLGIGVQSLGGLPGRYPPSELGKLADADFFLSAWNARQKTFLPCDGKFAEAVEVAGCLKVLDAAPTVALFGDSHAEHLFPGLSEPFKARGENLLFIGHHGCPPLQGIEVFDGSSSLDCGPANSLATRLLVESTTIHTVILSSRGPLYISGRDFGAAAFITRTLRSNDPAEQNEPPEQLFLNGLSRTIAALLAAGKQVVYVLDVPEMGLHPASCLARATLAPRIPDCAVSRSLVDARQAAYRKLLSTLAARDPQMRIYDPATSLCDPARCYAEIGGRILYRDSNHLSVVGSDYVATSFMNWLGAPRASVTGARLEQAYSPPAAPK